MRILDVVRSKVLDFTIELERVYPDIRTMVAAPKSTEAVSAGANRAFQQTIYAQNVTNNAVSFVSDLEQIIERRVSQSGGSEAEKESMLKSVRRAGTQEVVKLLVQKASDLFPLISNLG